VFQILKDTHFDFMGMRKIWVSISAVLLVLSLGILVTKGINRGIEFTGGTEVQVKYAGNPDLGAIRSDLAAAGISNYLVTTIGDPEEHEVYIRIGAASLDEVGEDLTPKVVEALRTDEVRQKRAQGMVDLNVADETTVRSLLERNPDLAREDAAALADAITDARRDAAIFRSVGDLARVPGMRPDVLSFLEEHSLTGPFSVRGQSYIGPAIGRELIQKALLAIVGSLVGMLIYIAIRFQVDMGIAAVAALLHDTLITLGLFSLFGKEMSLPVVAAFLTLIGYSVNDTVVIFDRVRENLKLRAGMDINAILNLSLNQTLSRTIITSLLTWLVVLALLFFGGEALNPFAFVLAIGIVIGSYSTIYIASPILVFWQKVVRKGNRSNAKAKGATKVRKSAKSA
jgi:preprotein translocase subunit SecF